MDVLDTMVRDAVAGVLRDSDSDFTGLNDDTDLVVTYGFDSLDLSELRFNLERQIQQKTGRAFVMAEPEITAGQATVGQVKRWTRDQLKQARIELPGIEDPP